MSITRTLAQTVADYQDPASLGSRLRARRIAPLLRFIQELHARKGDVRILDVGGMEA